jgi:D-glycero-alpha-D-manno-heptose-7-phosphate kinase
MSRAAASAPSRIDLAGGTIDIWPLYLLHDGAMTVNVSIELRARVEARSGSAGRVELISRDRGQRAVRSMTRPVRVGEKLELLARLASTLGPRRGVRLVSSCEAPAGSGLGGSSTLAIAAGAALTRLSGRRLDGATLIPFIRDEEVKVIRIPAGIQDYYPAYYGGAMALHLEAGGVRREPIPIDAGLFASRVVLCDSGKSRASGMSNWDMIRRRISGERRVARHMQAIVDAASAMRCALLASDWDAAGEALDAEGRARRGLSSLVETPRIAVLMRAARRAGAIGGKVCGAGGGGCVAFIVRAGRREDVEAALSKAGGRVLPVVLARRGIVWE